MSGKGALVIGLVVLANLAACGEQSGPGDMTANGTMGGGTSEGTPETMNQVGLTTGNSAGAATSNSAGSMGNDSDLVGNSSGTAMSNSAAASGNTVDPSAH